MTEEEGPMGLEGPGASWAPRCGESDREQDMVGVGAVGKMCLAIWLNEPQRLQEWNQEAPILVSDHLQFCFCLAWQGGWEIYGNESMRNHYTF